jgi:hypothetical protein
MPDLASGLGKRTWQADLASGLGKRAAKRFSACLPGPDAAHDNTFEKPDRVLSRQNRLPVEGAFERRGHRQTV